MTRLLFVLAIGSSLAFFRYGLLCLLSPQVRLEYRRYGIPQLRTTNGTLQLLGALGLAIGFVVWPIGALAATGLTVMMLLGLLARVGLGDHPLLMIPAFTLAILNWVIALLFITLRPMVELL